MTARPVVIYGNGAMARVLHSYVRHAVEVAGFTVDGHCIADAGGFQGRPLVPFEEVDRAFPPDRYDMFMSVGFVDMNGLRAAKSQEAEARGYRLRSYVHPGVLLHDDVVIGDNCIIYDSVAIHPGARIGTGTFIATNVSIGHDCVIGPYNWINSGVSLAGDCTIGPSCFFGVNACVADGVRIGERTFVGAGTMIAKDTGPDEVHVSPAGQKLPLSSGAFLKFKRRRGG